MRYFLFPLVLSVFAQCISISASHANDGCKFKILKDAKVDSVTVVDRLGRVPTLKRPARVVFVTQMVKDLFWSEAIAGMQEEAAQHGVTVTAVEPKDRSNGQEQFEVARAALRENPDALIVAPINSTNLLPVLDEARAKGIPTIMLNSPLPGADVYVGTSHAELGRRVAEYFHELYPAGAKIGQIEGLTDSPYTQQRRKGFTEELQTTPNLTLVSSRPADWNTERARQVTLEMMRAHPDIRAIYAHADVMALGVVQALKEIGRHNDVVVAGTDATAPAKRSIRDGGMRATAAQFPHDEGLIAVRTAIRLLGCQTVPAWIVSPQSLITPESLPDYGPVSN